MLFVCTCVGSFISSEEDDASNCDPSVVLISLDHHDWDLVLKSPVIINSAGLQLFISLRPFQIN